MVLGADAEADAGADAGSGAPSRHSSLAQPGPKQNMKAVLPGICKPLDRNALVQGTHKGVGKAISHQQQDPA